MLRFAISSILSVILLIWPAAIVAQDSPTIPPWRQPLPEGRDSVAITVGERELQVDLATTPPQQSLGLGFRNGLEPGTGMLFVFDQSSPRTFWMRGMRFCLDIIWIENNQIVGAAENACPDPEGTTDPMRARYSSGEPVRYVLEVPSGWMADHGYGPGTPVDLSNVPEFSI